MRQVIDLERLEAARRAAGFDSWQKLAKASGVNHATLSRLRRGQVDKANPETLQQLAGTLRVPLEWLTGEMDSLPHVLKHGLLSQKEPTDPETVTPERIRRSWLLQRVAGALLRDLERWQGRSRAEVSYRLWGGAFLDAVDALCSIIMWRDAMLEPTGSPGVIYAFESTADVAWVERLLEPWLEDVAVLRARVLRDTLRCCYEVSDRVIPSPTAERYHLQALAAYEQAKEEAQT
jgi:transcriptional regulator with XRE-family HTH domain